MLTIVGIFPTAEIEQPTAQAAAVEKFILENSENTKFAVTCEETPKSGPVGAQRKSQGVCRFQLASPRCSGRMEDAAGKEVPADRRCRTDAEWSVSIVTLDDGADYCRQGQTINEQRSHGPDNTERRHQNHESQ